MDPAWREKGEGEGPTPALEEVETGRSEVTISYQKVPGEPRLQESLSQGEKKAKEDGLVDIVLITQCEDLSAEPM